MELSWDIFTGYKRTGQESEARAEIKRLKSLVDEERLVVTQEVTQAYLGLKEAQESIKTAEVGVRQAKENLEMARGRYKEGESNAIEFNDAQISYTKARSSLVQATYAFCKAWAELEYAMGGDSNYLNAADQQNPQKIAENK